MELKELKRQFLCCIVNKIVFHSKFDNSSYENKEVINMKDKLYEFENNGFSCVRWKLKRKRRCAWNFFQKKRVVGVKANVKELDKGYCFGYTMIWVNQMLTCGRENSHPPSEMQAGLLQQRVEMMVRTIGWRKAVRNITLDLGLKVVYRVSSLWAQCASRVSCEQGFYLVDIGMHWVSMGRDIESFYYFDPNEGLYVFDSKSDFITKVNSAECLGYYASNGWMNNTGEQCYIYKIISI